MNAVTHPQQAQPQSHSRLTEFACLATVALAGVAIPAGGLVLAVVYAFTVLRGHRRMGAVAVGIGVVLAVLMPLLAGTVVGHGHTIGPAIRVQ